MSSRHRRRGRPGAAVCPRTQISWDDTVLTASWACCHGKRVATFRIVTDDRVIELDSLHRIGRDGRQVEVRDAAIGDVNPVVLDLIRNEGFAPAEVVHR